MSCSEEAAASFSSHPSEQNHFCQRLSTDSSQLLFLVALLPAQHPVEAGELVWLSAAVRHASHTWTSTLTNKPSESIRFRQMILFGQVKNLQLKWRLSSRLIVLFLRCPAPLPRLSPGEEQDVESQQTQTLSKTHFWQLWQHVFHGPEKLFLLLFTAAETHLKPLVKSVSTRSS